MFYSIFFLLFPICVLYQKNKKTEFFNSKKTILDIHKDENTLINFKKKYDGFDLSRNQSEINYNDFDDNDNNDDDDINKSKLQKIIIYFRNLKRLNFLQSPFVSEIEKLKCAEEILLENFVKKEDNNHFWETFEDVFF